MSRLARVLVALASLSLTPIVAQAGWITPAQVPGGIDPARVTMSWAQGAELPPNGAFTTEYAASGLVLDRVALVNGASGLGWAPVGSRMLSPDYPIEFNSTINYARGYNGVIEGHFVVPNTDRLRPVSVLRVAYEGLNPDEIGLIATYNDGSFVYLTPRVYAGGPGEVVMEITSPVGFSGFETYGYLTPIPGRFHAPWRVVGVEFELMKMPGGGVSTPEPATGVMAILGLGGVAWRVRKGRGSRPANG